MIEYEHGKFIDPTKVTHAIWRIWTDPGTGCNHYVLCISSYGAPDIEIIHGVWCNAFAIEKKIKEAQLMS